MQTRSACFRSDTIKYRGSGSSVCIVTELRAVRSGIETRWGKRYFRPSRLVLGGPTQPHAQWLPASFKEVKRPGRGVDHPPACSEEFEYRVALYIYFTSGPPWPVVGWPLPLLTFLTSWVVIIKEIDIIIIIVIIIIIIIIIFVLDYGRENNGYDGGGGGGTFTYT